MKAAEVVSPATRPINLYYGLVQAGLAMTAAHAEGTWTFDKHGLKSPDMKCGIPDISVRPEGVGAFQAVSNATRSERITPRSGSAPCGTHFPNWRRSRSIGTANFVAVDLLADRDASVEEDDWSTDITTEAAEFLRAT